MADSQIPINLLRGYPNPSLLPVEALNVATNRLLGDRKLAEQSLLYGPDAGWPPLLQALSKWLGSFYHPVASKTYAADQEAIPVERLITTCGASQSLAVILNVLTDPEYTRKVWIVAPAYFLAFRMFEDAGFQGRMRSVPEHASSPASGVDVAWLWKELQKDTEKFNREGKDQRKGNHSFKTGGSFPKLYRHIIYIVPTFANPSSVTTSLSVREQLVECARAFDALIVCDDVYDMLQWQISGSASSSNNRQAKIPRVVDVDRYLTGGTDRVGADGYGNVISNGSFSKIGGPGCRLGWVESTMKVAQLLAESGTSKSGDTASVFMSAVMAELLDTKVLDQHIFETLQSAYASRYKTMMKAIDIHLAPLGVETASRGAQDGLMVGGYFVWITLPASLEANEVARQANQSQQLTVAKGQQFEVPGDPEGQQFRNSLRLSFAWEDEEKLVQGIERLASVIMAMKSR